MICFRNGNLLQSEAAALVNPVNLDGVMGAGLALQFRKAYPKNYMAYRDACTSGIIDIGKLFLFKEKAKTIINFPTKVSWKRPSQYLFIEKGLQDLRNIMQNPEIDSIAIPALGCGLGVLDFARIARMIEVAMMDVPAVVNLYYPAANKN